jgi:hypothetical protein
MMEMRIWRIWIWILKILNEKVFLVPSGECDHIAKIQFTYINIIL